VSNYAERLATIAQRLDELADDGPSELTDISEELGRIADSLPSSQVRDDTPRWLAEMRSLVERSAMEIVSQRYGSGQHGMYTTVNIPNHDFFAAQAIVPTLNPKDAVKIFGSIT
jgi:hypothetical protein